MTATEIPFGTLVSQTRASDCSESSQHLFSRMLFISFSDRSVPICFLAATTDTGIICITKRYDFSNDFCKENPGGWASSSYALSNQLLVAEVCAGLPDVCHEKNVNEIFTMERQKVTEKYIF